MGMILHGHGCQKIQFFVGVWITACPRVPGWHFFARQIQQCLLSHLLQPETISKEVMCMFGRCCSRMEEIAKVQYLLFLRWRNHCGTRQKERGQEEFASSQFRTGFSAAVNSSSRNGQWNARQGDYARPKKPSIAAAMKAACHHRPSWWNTGAMIYERRWQMDGAGLRLWFEQMRPIYYVHLFARLPLWLNNCLSN